MDFFPQSRVSTVANATSPQNMMNTKHRTSLLSLILAGFGIITATIGLYGQEDTKAEDCTSGRLYYIAFPDTVQTRINGSLYDNNRDRFLLHVYSTVEEDRNNRIRITRMDSGQIKTLTVRSRDVREIDITHLVAISSEINKPLRTVLRIESDYPIIIYVLIHTNYGSAAFTPMPVKTWGVEYYTASWKGEVVGDVEHNEDGQPTSFNLNKKISPAQVMVIAAYDNTHVQFFPKGELRDCNGCTENIVLNAGQVYVVQSVVDTGKGDEEQVDIAGSFVRSNKPIGVVSGNMRAGLRYGRMSTYYAVSTNTIRDLTAEWIPPVSTYGTRFVQVPVWEDQREFWDAGEMFYMDTVERLRLIRTGGELQGSIWKSNGKSEMFQTTDVLYDITVDSSLLHGITTVSPAFAFSSPAGMYSDKTITTGSNYGVYSWGTAMVEQVPQEEWVSFAPFRAPSKMSGMRHFLTVVTDTLNRDKIFIQKGRNIPEPFLFNRGTIPGTDFIAGSLRLDTEVAYRLEGDDGARFTGHVHGAVKGEEDVHYSLIDYALRDYREYNGRAYSYPLAPSRCILATPDVIDLSVEGCCCERVVHLSTRNRDPSGLSNVYLLEDSSSNTTLDYISPTDPKIFNEQKISEAQVRLRVTDPTKDGRAVLVYRDRTREGKRLTYTFPYVAPRVLPTTSHLDLGSVEAGETSEEHSLLFVNRASEAVTVTTLELAKGDQGFQITRTEPAFDWMTSGSTISLERGDTLRVFLSITPPKADRIYSDTLVLPIDCLRQTVYLSASTADSSLSVEDEMLEDNAIIAVTPNPFSGKTEISFKLGKAGETTVEVYDAAGRKIALLVSERLAEGEHALEWDGEGEAAGVYYVRITSGEWSLSRSIHLVR